jgi:hypothetical protein
MVRCNSFSLTQVLELVRAVVAMEVVLEAMAGDSMYLHH